MSVALKEREMLLKQLNELCPDFVVYLNNIVDYHDGRKEKLNGREREIAIIASLITQGAPENPLYIHFTKALKNGLSHQELCEVILQISVYSGMPSAIRALQQLHRIVFSEQEGDLSEK